MPIFKSTEKLWKHQREMVDFSRQCFQEYGFSLWIAGMATGKSAASLKVRHDIEARRTLILSTKASVETTWPKQVAEHTEGVAIMAVTDVYGSSARKAKAILDRVRGNEDNLIIAVNYETAMRIADTLAKCGFDFVIADECHKMKTHTSKTTKALAKACKDIPAKIGMTGTAFNDRPTDVFGQVAFLSPDFYKGHLASTIFGRWNDFFDAYTIYYVSNNIKIVKGYKNYDKLLDMLKPFTYFIETEDAVELPPVMYIRRTVEPSKTLKRMYNEMKDDMVTRLGDTIFSTDTVLTQSLRLAQMTGGYATPYHIDGNGMYVPTGDIIEIPDGDCKLQGLLDIMDEVGKEPVVIFTRFTEDVNRISKRLRTLGYAVKELTGRVHEHGEFQNGKGDVLVANLSAGSASVTLTRARIVIDYSLGYSRTDYDQSRYRCRRPDSDLNKPIVYYQLAVADTIDELIFDALQSKGDVADILRAGLLSKVA
jgi:SNF2 family DNA or RNA helicase